MLVDVPLEVDVAEVLACPELVEWVALGVDVAVESECEEVA
jgi:hypothetical protein